MRTYTRADVDNEKVKVNVEEEISQPVSQPENDNSQKLLVQENIEDNVEDRLKNSINKKPYETEQFIVANITSIKNTQVANSQKNPTNLNTKQDIEKSRSGLKEIRERVLSNPDRIPVSEEDILMAKRRIIEKHGLNVPLIE